MAEAVVSGVVRQLGDLLLKQAKHEIDLLTGVEQEVRNLSETFKSIQAELVDAERRRITEESVKFWLQKLEHVSYEIEDVLDEWNYQILRKEIEGSSSNNIARVCFFILSSVCFFNLSSCFWFKELAVNREIAVKIKKLNAKLNFIAKEKKKFNFVKSSGDSWKPVPSNSFVDESDVSGRKTDKENLINQLLSEDKHAIQVVSITGTGGIGKTTLAQLVYNDDQVMRHYNERVWVCVSNPFDEIRIAKAILEALDSKSPKLNEFNSLLEQIRRSIFGKKLLLVFDDVWTEDQMKWQPFKDSLKYGAPGSTILLTTRNEEVATVAGATCTIPLGVLSESDSWSLFCKVAFFDRTDQIEHARFETIGREITSKCKGLPLAIKTLGGLLCSKNTLEEWQQVRDSNMWELEVAEVQLFPHMYLSYIDLSPPLKRCFSYCAVFPKDYRIDVDELIRAWLGQGYLNSTKSESEMELKGRQYFNDLAKRSFFQDFEKDFVFGETIDACKMHDIVHDFAQFLMKTECFIIQGEKKETFPNNAHHLTWFGSEEAIDTLSNCNMAQLRSFWANNFKLGTLLNSLKLVRSLKLNKCSFKELPKNIGNLIHLRYLGLCDNDELRELPTTVYDLYNLQTLDLEGCWELKELPPGIEKLKKLRHLFPSKRDMNYPEGIGKLTCLQTLKSFVVKEEHNNLGYLKSLNQLQGSLNIVIKDNLDVADAKDADFKSKKRIQDLSFNLSNLIRETDAIMEALESPPNIQILYVCSYEGTRLATWMTSLKHLRHLTLEYFSDLTSLPSLGILPALEKLKMTEFSELKFVGPTFLGIRESSPLPSVGFPMLEEFELIRCVKWEEWEDITLEEEEDDTVSLMPHLRWLTMGECPNLKTLPYRLLRKASSLQCIQLDEKKYNPSTILSTTLTLAEVKARKPQYQSMSKKEALQLERLQKAIANVRSNHSNLQLRGTIQFNELPYKNGVPNNDIRQSGIIFRFVEFLTREDFPKLQFEAASAFVAMASGTLEYKRVVIDHGALPNLVKLIGSTSDDIREMALMALGNIVVNFPECCDLVLKHGALMPLLFQLNEHADVKMLRLGAWVLRNFCYEIASQFEQLKLALPTLRSLIYSNDEEVLKYACKAFSHLSNGTNDNIQLVIEADICQRLVELLLHPSPIVLIPTLVIVGNIMSGNYIQTQCIIDNGALPRLLSLLSHNHEESNSSITTENRDEIQVSSRPLKYRSGARPYESGVQPQNSGTRPHHFGARPQQSSSARTATTSTVRIPTSTTIFYLMFEAARALRNITAGTSENIRMLIDHGAVPIFVKLLGSPSKDVCEQAVSALANIAADEDDIQTQCIIDNGALPCLLSLLSHNHEESNSSITTENKDEIQFEAARALRNITAGTSENIRMLIDHGAVPIFVKLLGSPSKDVCEQAVSALVNIAADEDDIQTQCIIDNGALPCLLSLLSHNHEESNSSITTENKDEIQFEAARALRNITAGTSENIRMLIDHGAVPIFVKLLGSPSKDVCEQAVSALANIAADEDDIQTQVIIDHGTLPCLLSLLTHNHENSIKEHACRTITNITAGNRDKTQAVIEAGLIAPLLNLLKTAEFDIKKEAAWAISNVTFNVTNEQMKFLVSESCIKPLCDLLVCPNPKIVTVCLRGLENILEVGEVEKNQGNTDHVNNFVQMIEEAQGIEKIKNLQSRDNDEIREIAVQILETYWLDKEKNDDNDDENDEEEEEEEKDGETLPEGNQA